MPPGRSLYGPTALSLDLKPLEQVKDHIVRRGRYRSKSPVRQAGWRLAWAFWRAFPPGWKPNLGGHIRRLAVQAFALMRDGWSEREILGAIQAVKTWTARRQRPRSLIFLLAALRRARLLVAAALEAGRARVKAVSDGVRWPGMTSVGEILSAWRVSHDPPEGA